MATTDASYDQHASIVEKRIIPLSTNYANEPTDLRYHRFYDEEADTEYEIFVPPGKEQEVLDLETNERWDKLREFPPFSDQSPLTMQPNVVGCPQADGTYEEFHVPEDPAKQARAVELMKAEDYKTLEEEFEPWSKYKQLAVAIPWSSY